MKLRMYEIHVIHPETKETLRFLGQGISVTAALADGAKVINESFRPSTNGPRHGPISLNVMTAGGQIVLKTLKDFEDPPAPAAEEIDPP